MRVGASRLAPACSPSVAFCDVGQPRAGLDHGERRRLAASAGSSLVKRAQHVLHQRAAAGADLGERDRRRPADRLPGAEQPDADQLAEHLADLRRGDEVAGRAERLARRVVAVVRIEQAKRHVVGDADRAVGLDQADDLFAQPSTSVYARAGSAAGLPSPSPRCRPAPSAPTAPCPWSASRRGDSRSAGPARGRTRRRCAPARSRRRRRRRRSPASSSFR